MPIKPLEQRKRQQILLVIALAVMLVAVLILYFGLWRKEPVPQEIPLEEQALLPTELGTERTSAILWKKLESIDLDFSFFNQKILPFLKSHADLPVKKGETGRINPFIHY